MNGQEKQYADIKIITCKYCNSQNIVKRGKHNDIQYFTCKDCGHKFAANDALPNMRMPVKTVASSLQSFYDGLSVNDIRSKIRQDTESKEYPSESTVYDWITRYTKDAIDKTKELKPNVGYVWMADETVIEINGKKYWYWDVLDVKTRYLIASHLSTKRTVDDVIILMTDAVKSAGKFPKVIMTDHLPAYVDGIKLRFRDKVKHLQVKKFEASPNNNIIERLHGTIKERTKVMRGMKHFESAKLIMDGFRFHYNYCRNHETLDTKDEKFRTPSKQAGIELPYDTWLGFIKNEDIRHTELPRLEPIEFTQITFDRVEHKRKWERERKRRKREVKRQQNKESTSAIVVSRH
jgi:putative transposase